MALALQVGTNFANDYSDGVRGTDDPGRRVGPVRLVGWGIQPPGAVKRAALLSFGVAVVAGLGLAAVVGRRSCSWSAPPRSAAGWFYTGGSHPYGYYGFGELFVFTFFGVVATAGSAYVQTDELWALPLVASIPVGLWATALLVINNLRDIPGDTESGKRTLAVRIGDARTRWLYVAMLVVAFGSIPIVAGGFDRPARRGGPGRHRPRPPTGPPGPRRRRRPRPHPRPRRHRPGPARQRHPPRRRPLAQRLSHTPLKVCVRLLNTRS